MLYYRIKFGLLILALPFLIIVFCIHDYDVLFFGLSLF